MRVFLGLALLASVFALAAIWQARSTADMRRRQDHQRGAPSVAAEAPPGWSVLVAGRPSGAPPIADDIAPVPAAAAETWLPSAAEEADAEYTVRDGDVLSTICQAHYGARDARPANFARLDDLVAAIAVYNGLRSSDDIRSGQVLLLPETQRLTR